MKYGDKIRIKSVEKLYGRSEKLIETLEEIKDKGLIGTVISVDKEDCILDTYVSFKGYDNLWMSSEEELEKVSAYDNLQIVENIDDFIEAMKKLHEEELEEFDEEGEFEEVDIEEILDIEKKNENDLDIRVNQILKEKENETNKMLLNYLTVKFGYNDINEVLDDYYQDKLIDYISNEDITLREYNYVIARVTEIMLDLFELNRDNIERALEDKEFRKSNTEFRKMDDDDLEF